MKKKRRYGLLVAIIFFFYLGYLVFMAGFGTSFRLTEIYIGGKPVEK